MRFKRKQSFKQPLSVWRQSVRTRAMDLLSAYQTRLNDGGLHPDPAQQQVIKELAKLAHDVQLWAPEGGRGFSVFRRKASTTVPRSLYIVGPVGRGKSMMMDLFFNHVTFSEKRRVHFHAFMQEVHQRLHVLRKNSEIDAVAALAREITETTRLLCFDEFQVTDIADAMILSRLFTALFAQGLVMVATSNTAPRNLYAGGLQRDLFLPFIDLLTEKCAVLDINSPTDYRRLRLSTISTFHVPLGRAAEAAMAKAFAALTDDATPLPTNLEMPALGRSLHIPKAYGKVAWFDFVDLCEQPLGAADYEALASAYPVVMMSNVPVLTEEARNATRRFITLVDVLYEHKTRLVISAAVLADALCPKGLHAAEFARTASRLHEMQSAEWWGLTSVKGE
jgi:cell division protein ZapE